MQATWMRPVSVADQQWSRRARLAWRLSNSLIVPCQVRQQALCARTLLKQTAVALLVRMKMPLHRDEAGSPSGSSHACPLQVQSGLLWCANTWQADECMPAYVGRPLISCQAGVEQIMTLSVSCTSVRCKLCP